MTIFDKIKQRILKYLGVEKLDGNPNSDRFTFINDENTVKRQKVDECRIWYVGDSDELQNYYTNRDLSGNAKEPIYNRNKPNYFWGIAVAEQPVKKVHSGIPRAIVDTLSNAVDMPDISNEDEAINENIQKIIEVNNFTTKLTQEARPLTLVEGWGGWKVVFDKTLCDYPILQFYEGKDVEYVIKNGMIIGMIFKDFYKYKNQNYVLMETRRIDEGNSIIEFELFRLDKSNTVSKVPLNTIPELETLPEEGYIIEGLKKVLGVPNRYFFDLFDKEHGRSIFTGKIDIFDDMDQCLSQASQTDRVSTPVEYYPVDVIERGKNGETNLPKVYNRQFVKSVSFPDGDGNLHGEIKTTQPQLNYEQYISRFKSLIDVAITGILSPASMGIDIAKKDNADAQREKEKITIFTRNNIIAAETKMLKELFNVALMMKEYMDTNQISVKDYDISVKYCEFANPTFESMSSILLPMLTNGGISVEMYVDKLYGDSLSEEEKAQEIAKIKESQQKDDLELGDYGLNGMDENITNEDSGPEGIGEETTPRTEE
jgi:hypothetical protein